jgi:hypothetical protein
MAGHRIGAGNHLLTDDVGVEAWSAGITAPDGRVRVFMRPSVD